MQSFGAKYILTTQRDSSEIAYAILHGAGKNPDDYIRMVDGTAVPKDSARDLFLFKIWSGGGFTGTGTVYEDIKKIIVRIE